MRRYDQTLRVYRIKNNAKITSRLSWSNIVTLEGRFIEKIWTSIERRDQLYFVGVEYWWRIQLGARIKEMNN